MAGIEGNEVGFDPGQIKEYISTLSNYVDEQIAGVLLNHIQALVDVDIASYWHSPKANNFRLTVIRTMGEMSMSIKRELTAIQNKIINAYNYWAQVHNESKIPRKSDVYDAACEHNLWSMLSINFGAPKQYTKDVVNIAMINESTLPKLEEIKKTVMNNVEAIPKLEGFFDSQQQQSLAYDTSLASMIEIISDGLNKLYNQIKTDIQTAVDDSTLAKQQVEREFTA